MNVFSLGELKQAIAQTPEQWRPLVFTNGCFDLIHAGHVRYLQAARELGRSLVVGVNSDQSVRLLKPASDGMPLRPIVPEQERAEVIAALRAVDAVVIFAERTAIALIKALQPEVYVKGGDYQIGALPEVPIVRSYGGQIVLVPMEIDCSTSKIIERIMGRSPEIPG